MITHTTPRAQREPIRLWVYIAQKDACPSQLREVHETCNFATLYRKPIFIKTFELFIVRNISYNIAS